MLRDVQARVAFDLLPNNRLDTSLRIGVELEYEKVKTFANPPGWEAKRDGSLRGSGREFITSPITPHTAKSKLKQFMKAADGKISGTPRCGAHFHVNMRPLTVGNVMAFSAIYGFMEPTIFERFAPGRKTSVFCTPQHANLQLQLGLRNISNALRGGGAVVPFGDFVGLNKYCALNYLCLTQFGTVEFRMMPALVKPGEYLTFIDMLERMYEFCQEFDSPDQVVNEFELVGLEGFQDILLKETVDVQEDEQEDAYAATLIAAGEDNPNFN